MPFGLRWPLQAAMLSQSDTTALREYLGQYALERGIGVGSLQALHYVLNSFEKFLERTASVSDLDTDTLNDWLAWQFVAGLDPETIRGRRTAMLGMWRDAHAFGFASQLPGRIRKIKVPQKPPRCWDKSREAPLLLAAVAELAGTMNKDARVSRADFWTAWILVGYYSGLRLSDLLALRFDQVAADGTIVTVQAKTGDVVVGRLRPDGIRAVAAIFHGRAVIFGELMNRWNAGRYFRKIVRDAGLQGSTKWLRRTGATWTEVETPGAAMAYLGHRTPGLAYRNYVDPRFVSKHKPAPPKFGP